MHIACIRAHGPRVRVRVFEYATTPKCRSTTLQSHAFSLSKLCKFICVTISRVIVSDSISNEMQTDRNRDGGRERERGPDWKTHPIRRADFSVQYRTAYIRPKLYDWEN